MEPTYSSNNVFHLWVNVDLFRINAMSEINNAICPESRLLLRKAVIYRDRNAVHQINILSVSSHPICGNC
jgi:hypothetical protein